MSRPIIAITMGDAAGVGPEIIMKALAHAAGLRALLSPGDRRRGAPAAGRRDRRCLRSRFGRSRSPRRECVPSTAPSIASISPLIPEDLPWGRLSPVAGDAAFRYIERAVALASAGEVDAICTAPLNKEALHAGGHHLSGPYRDPGGADGYARSLDDADDAEAARDPRDDPYRPRSMRSRGSSPAWSSGRSCAGTRPWCGRDRQRRASACAGSILTPANTACSAVAKRRRRSSRLFAALRARGIDVEGPLPADTLFFRRSAATSISSSRCTTIRGTDR